MSTTLDHFLRWGGWISAFITGLGMPSFVFLIGDAIDTFNPRESTPQDMLDEIKMLALIFTLIGVGVWVFAYSYYTLLLIFAERVTKRTRVEYLKSILKQDCSWFDTTNP